MQKSISEIFSLKVDFSLSIIYIINSTKTSDIFYSRELSSQYFADEFYVVTCIKNKELLTFKKCFTALKNSGFILCNL